MMKCSSSTCSRVRSRSPISRRRSGSCESSSTTRTAPRFASSSWSPTSPVMHREPTGFGDSAGVGDSAGFTLIELLVASTVTLLVLGATLSTFGNALAVNDATTLIGDSSQNLRAGGSLMMRELMQAGRGIPTGGIPIPSGALATAIKRPGPPGTNYTFGDPSVMTVLAPVVPGPGLGPTVLGVPTDIVTLLLVDKSLALDKTPAGDPVFCTVAADGSSIIADPTIVINAPDTGIVAGDLILITNNIGSAVQTVTS